MRQGSFHCRLQAATELRHGPSTRDLHTAWPHNVLACHCGDAQCAAVIRMICVCRQCANDQAKLRHQISPNNAPSWRERNASADHRMRIRTAASKDAMIYNSRPVAAYRIKVYLWRRAAKRRAGLRKRIVTGRANERKSANRRN